MSQLSAKYIWRLDSQEFVNLLDSGVFMQQGSGIRFYAPSFAYYKSGFFCSSPNVFPTISVTGSGCALNCKHCGGKVLSGMRSVFTSDDLFSVCSELKRYGAVGCLISGGCLSDGSVPLKPFVAAITRVKRELGLTVFVHTGILDLETAVLLKQSAVDAVLIDVIGSQEIIDKVYRLNVTVRDYAKSLGVLQKVGLPFVPHVIVGLNEGKLGGEYRALQMISKTNPSAVVIIAFMPLRGTEMAYVKPPQPYDIVRVVALARVMFPKIPLVLGCMRPKGKSRIVIDVLALKAGVNAIVFPSQQAVDFAKMQGWSVSFSSCCCAKIFTDFAMFK
ncbi:MAG: radical SAM protein [Candidatus Bathyarchaeota archaeon]|nr:radical SAM protein [Candidatus Termiticorpusculum sp.]